MNGLIKKLQDIWSVEELRNRILLTVGFLAVYRFGSFVILPGINAEALAAAVGSNSGGLIGLLDTFTGGSFFKAAVFALGIMPYISASIIVQLLGFAVPYFQKLQKDGENGQRKLNQITRVITIAITIVQGSAYLTYLNSQQGVIMPQIPPTVFWLANIIILTAGTVFCMWLGERITDKGIGNGISLLIMVGIIATLPQSFVQNMYSRLEGSNGGFMMILIELVIWFLIILASVFLVMAVRKIAVQYARRTASGGYEKNVFGSRQFLPLKLNASGVMPIIFAQAIMFVPSLIGGSSWLKDTSAGAWMETNFADIFGFWYNLVFALLIIIFTYFYTAITVPTNKMADDLKRSGGFIPGIRPGSETSEYLDKIMSQITLPGSIFLALVAVFPAFVMKLMNVQPGWALFFGGTSLLIMVGVAIDTMQQINSYLLNKHYDGLMKTGKNRKSVSQ